jgi:hypothetical protein
LITGSAQLQTIITKMTAIMRTSPITIRAGADAEERRWFVAATFLAIGLRVLVFGVGLLSLHAAPPTAEPRFNYEHPWMAFDARSYRELSQHGYAATRQGTPYLGGSSFTLIAYFPMMPLLGRALSSIMPLDTAMLMLSNVCSIIGFAFLFDWARRLAGARTAAICVLLAATFPGAVSFAAGMTEGPFFMLVAIVLWLLESEKFVWAALIAAVATATRPTGVALAILPPICAWFHQSNTPRSHRLAQVALLGAISFSGIVCYEAFLWHRYQSPLAFLQAESHWNDLNQQRLQQQAADHVDRRSFEFFLDNLLRPQAWNRAIAVPILFVTLAGLIWQTQVPRGMFLLPLVIFLMTALPGGGLRISSVPRYESVAAPLFLLVALWLSPRRRTRTLVALLLLQLAIQLYYAALFPRQIWVG